MPEITGLPVAGLHPEALRLIRKSTQLRRMLYSPTLEFIMEAHNGLSAKIAEEAGFKGIWASGLSISASLGVRDNNEASWTQVVEVAEFMSDATSIPILLDGDTGYGNFNNMRRLVRKLEQRQIAGVCIEDKIFPKTNSFIDGEAQPLADIDEFAGKIKAGKDAQNDDDFCIVARVEALIAGWSLGEALKRAEAYRLAGADAVLIHSKKSTSSDIDAFMAEWAGRLPVVIVPTKYYSTPTAHFRNLGVSLVIWANHSMRSAVAAMRKTVATIHSDQSLVNVEDKVAPLKDVFRLQGDAELQLAEDRYLPRKDTHTQGIILAASRGIEMGELTTDKPKAMIEVGGRPVLLRLVDDLNSLGLKNVTVVRGYMKEAVQGTNFSVIDNDRSETTKDLYSLYLARQCLNGGSIVVYGDTLFRKYLLSEALAATGDITVVVDADLTPGQRRRDLALCTKACAKDFFNASVQLRSMATGSNIAGFHGEWAGVLSMNGTGAKQVAAMLDTMAARPDFLSLTLIDLINELAAAHTVSIIYTRGGWIDIDEAKDLEKAGGFYA
jgi:phosphoenolpyruvate phosphomutase